MNSAGSAASSGVSATGSAAVAAAPVVGEAAGQAASATGNAAVAAAPVVGEAAGNVASGVGNAAASGASAAGSSGMCFPASASVREFHRGEIPISSVEVGDQVACGSGNFSRVIALLHAQPEAIVPYLHLRHTSGELTVSEQHLILACSARKAAAGEQASTDHTDAPSGVGHAVPTPSPWAWVPVRDVQLGDQLQGTGDEACTVLSVCCKTGKGMYAPLTASGSLVVDGVLCSCFAPPAAWAVPHAVCHAAMLPIRFLDELRKAVERWSAVGSTEAPLLTVDAAWLLPRGNVDQTVHPYAAGLLSAGQVFETAVKILQTLPAAGGRQCAALPWAEVASRKDGRA